MSDIIARRDHPFVGNIGKLLRLRSVFTLIKQGLLYNWYATSDSRNIASSGWHVPSKAEWDTLITAIGGSAGGAAKLKETGTVFWPSPNSAATDEYGFSARPTGNRGTNGSFNAQFTVGKMWTITDDGAGYAWFKNLYSSSSDMDEFEGRTYSGHAVRLVKNDSINTGTYTGNDGKTYPTVKIGDQVWVKRNLAETKYRNGDSIPEITTAATWPILTSGALCAFNNDWNNV